MMLPPPCNYSNLHTLETAASPGICGTSSEKANMNEEAQAVSIEPAKKMDWEKNRQRVEATTSGTAGQTARFTVRETGERAGGERPGRCQKKRTGGFVERVHTQPGA